MALYENVKGTIKEITSLSTNVGGTIKTITLLHENVGGTLKQIFPKVIENKYNARIQITGGGGILGRPPSSSTNFSSIGEIGPGLVIDMNTSASGSSSGGSPTMSFHYKTLVDGSNKQYVYITSNCKVTVKITCGSRGSSGGTATFGINGVTKFDSSKNGNSYTATFNLTPSDYISASSKSSATGSAGSSVTYTTSVSYTLTFTSA